MCYDPQFRFSPNTNNIQIQWCIVWLLFANLETLETLSINCTLCVSNLIGWNRNKYVWYELESGCLISSWAHTTLDPRPVKYTFPLLWDKFCMKGLAAHRANILYERMGKVWCRANTTFDPRLLCENWPPLNRLSLAYSVKVAKSKLFSKHNVWSKTKRLFSLGNFTIYLPSPFFDRSIFHFPFKSWK